MRWVSYAYRSQSACDDDAIDPIPIATNAVKYGALSVPSGRLRVEWSRGEAEIVIRWSEADGPPVKPQLKPVTKPVVISNPSPRRSRLRIAKARRLTLSQCCERQVA